MNTVHITIDGNPITIHSDKSVFSDPQVPGAVFIFYGKRARMEYGDMGTHWAELGDGIADFGDGWTVARCIERSIGDE